MLRKGLGAVLVITLLVYAAGCLSQGLGRKPALPPQIDRGENREPVLNVYVVEDEQLREFGFEDYVAGVLAGEMHNYWPENALAAQAVLARTFALKFVQEKESRYDGAHISTDIEEAQAWNAEAVNDRVRQAVAETRGQVIVHKNDFINAWFHAHAGGKTASAKEGLAWKDREPAYIQVVESPDSPDAPPGDADWTAFFTRPQVVEALGKLGATPGDFDAIEIVKRGPSGRAETIRVGNAAVAGADLRIALGSTEMKSTKLKSVAVDGDGVTMTGEGYGHGVGVSQWGAYQMAVDGRSPEEIIQHYYKNVRIIKMWE